MKITEEYDNEDHSQLIADAEGQECVCRVRENTTSRTGDDEMKLFFVGALARIPERVGIRMLEDGQRSGEREERYV